MTNFSMKPLLKPLSVTVFAVATLFASMTGSAQTLHKPQPRITAPIDDTHRLAVHGMSPSAAIRNTDLGKLDPSMPVEGITLMFSRTPEQEADLQALMAAQQDIHSPLYHQWLDPEAFGARFGMSPDDISKVQVWLQHEGFTVTNVAHANNAITFSGSESLIESAFGTELHNFKMPDGSVHFAPAGDLTFPEAIAPNVLFVRGLNTFRHRRHSRRLFKQVAKPGFTQSYTKGGGQYLATSADLAVEYDVTGAYKAGYTGAGQSIAVVGVSAILQSDISTYDNATGYTTAKPPILVLVPGSGPPFHSPGDEGESDLDVEYSSTIAKGAQVYFVYTGYNYNNGTDDAIAMSVDDKIAPVITVSYGDCEPVIDLIYDGTTYFTAQDAVYSQAVTQGQTIMASAGDDGSTDCEEYLGEVTLAASQAPAVDYPASSPYIVGVGGTSFTVASVTYPNTTYWTDPAAGTTLNTSLIAYAPETTWNDDQPNPNYYYTSSGGGGESIYEAAPAWQIPTPPSTTLPTIGGITIPALPTVKIGKNTVVGRAVPDVALQASIFEPGLIECSSDPDPDTGEVYVCTNTSLVDPVSGYINYGGGTSYAAPTFAGMVAVLNQAMNSEGQGNLSQALWTLLGSTNANAAAVYKSAFHDITVGSNACYDQTVSGGPGYPTPPAPMPVACGVTSAAVGSAGEYQALPGFDLATGLGSVDLLNLINAWPKPTSATLIGTTTVVSAATLNTSGINTPDPVTITVASASGSTIPTGTVTITVGTAAGNTLVAGGTVTLTSAGTAPYIFNSPILGNNIVYVSYSGDSTHAASQGIVAIYNGVTAAPKILPFSLAANDITVVTGATTGTSTLTTNAVGAYTGQVAFSFAGNNVTTTLNICISAPNVTLTGPTPQLSTITVITNTTAVSCPTGTTPLLKKVTTPITLSGLSDTSPRSPWKNAPLPITMAGLLLVICVRRRSSLARAGVALAFFITLSVAGLGLSGCSSSSSAASSTPVCTSNCGVVPTPPPVAGKTPSGTYSIIVTGTDVTNSTVTSGTTFNLIVQ